MSNSRRYFSVEKEIQKPKVLIVLPDEIKKEYKDKLNVFFSNISHLAQTLNIPQDE
jgi:hypothetical protein